jgi:penicillin V acylase-like amidase (Ntn superfamily)
MCSTVILGAGAERLLAANYDYSLGHGLVATNLQGTAKENGREPEDPAVRWVVRHGSVTLNSVSLELPTAGMNRAGLSIALMWHDDGDFGAEPVVRRIDPLQWIQYQLDNHATVHEVIDSLADVRPKAQGIPLHYTLLDGHGDGLLLEFLGGEPQVLLNPPEPVLTNSSHAACVAGLDTVSDDAIRERTSLGRFAELVRRGAASGPQADVAAAFDALSRVQQGSSSGGDPWAETTKTVWSVVFQPARHSIHLSTHGNRTVRRIELEHLDLSANSRYACLDIHEGPAGDVTGLLRPYDRADCERIVEASAPALPMSVEERRNLVDLVDATYRLRRMPPLQPPTSPIEGAA